MLDLVVSAKSLGPQGVLRPLRPTRYPSHSSHSGHLHQSLVEAGPRIL